MNVSGGLLAQKRRVSMVAFAARHRQWADHVIALPETHGQPASLHAWKHLLPPPLFVAKELRDALGIELPARVTEALRGGGVQPGGGSQRGSSEVAATPVVVTYSELYALVRTERDFADAFLAAWAKYYVVTQECLLRLAQMPC
jgi:hypothetical protein